MSDIDFDFTIQSALRARLRTVAGYPGDDMVAWEGKTFASPAMTVPPVAPATWIRETFVPSSEMLVATSTIEALGYVQYGVFYQSNQGIRSASRIARAIINSFRPGLTLASLVWISQAQRTRALPEADWMQIPVTIYWRAFRDNSP